ncbi:hypothetical protein [Luteolibacter sp. Populi]|uniref:hypothetical protein n=1 Tax=Luteolibacter sp. Populi TaxID=3230487 RepID=UPI003465426E
MTSQLTLLRSGRATTTVSAGWLASGDPLEWLREIGHCLKQGCPVAAYPVASSLSDPRPAGVFLLPRGKVPEFRARVQLLAELLPGVHAPRDATLSAGLLVNEREFFFPYRVHFFHPTLGLAGFDAKDELSPAKLLAIPPGGEVRWNLAVPVEKFAPELKSIVIAEPEGPEEMLAEAGSGIGDQAGATGGENPVMDKLGMLGKGLAGGLVLGGSWVVGGLGKISDFLSGPGMIGVPPGSQGGQFRAAPPDRNRLREWAEKNWQHLMDKRSREIERLMRLMEDNPDEGLRRALPLTGLEQSRGKATPSWNLGQRSTDFRLGSGGGAIDGWDIGNEARLKLERQYREAALRETALGRHERAAYIYGNLLGDWAAAAKALMEAGRHRDAVSIYIHKLNNRHGAARALEEASLLLQAAAMYAELKQYEKAGDLHAKLGNDTMAREMWQAEVAAQGSALVKARILATKLKEPAAALEILEAVWRAGDMPGPALDAIFEIHREAEDLPAAMELVRAIFATKVGVLPLPTKLTLIDGQCRKWQYPAFRGVFEGLAYRHIAGELEAKSAHAKQLMEFLPKLDPDDLLLDRDARRFSLVKNPPKVPASGPPKGTLKPEQTIRVASDVKWHSMATLPRGVSLAGYGKDMLAVAQFRENGCHSSALHTGDDPGNGFVDHVVVSSSRGSSRLFHFRDHRRLHYRALDRVRTADDDAIGTLEDVLAIAAHGDEGDFAVLQYTRTDSLVVHIYSEAAKLRRTVTIDLAPPDILGLEWQIAGRGDDLFFSAAKFCVWRDKEGKFSQVHLEEPARSLALSPRGSRPRMLIARKGEVLQLDVQETGEMALIAAHSTPLPDLTPTACFLADGSVVVAWKGGGEVYPAGSPHGRSATLDFPREAGSPVAICPKGNGGFAILTDSGNLLVFPR